MVCDYCDGWSSKPLRSIDNIYGFIKDKLQIHDIRYVCEKCYTKIHRYQIEYTNKLGCFNSKEEDRKYRKSKHKVEHYYIKKIDFYGSFEDIQKLFIFWFNCGYIEDKTLKRSSNIIFNHFRFKKDASNKAEDNPIEIIINDDYFNDFIEDTYNTLLKDKLVNKKHLNLDDFKKHFSISNTTLIEVKS